MLTMTTISSNRRQEIKGIVLSALQRSPDATLPVKIKAICKSYENIRLIPYSVHMKRHNLSYEEMKEYCGTSDSCADFYANFNKYIIYYNDIDLNIAKSNRYRWNIAHELGHILLGHHKKSDKTRILRSTLTDQEYRYLEEEADYFAQLILVPHVVLYAFKVRTEANIMYLCKISQPAAKRRLLAFRAWANNIQKGDFYDRALFYYFYTFIYKKQCRLCGVGLVQREGKYCPICGSKNTLQWGDGDKLKYKMIELNQNSKALRCPVCDNEEIPEDGVYCPICGTMIRNQCTNYPDQYNEGCGAPAAGNARYCIYCGARTTFFENNILKAWNDKDSSDFVNIPDELPFS